MRRNRTPSSKNSCIFSNLNRRYQKIALPYGCIYGITLKPRLFIAFAFPLFAWSYSHIFIWQVNSSSHAKAISLKHRSNPINPHVIRPPIKVGIAASFDSIYYGHIVVDFICPVAKLATT